MSTVKLRQFLHIATIMLCSLILILESNNFYRKRKGLVLKKISLVRSKCIFFVFTLILKVCFLTSQSKRFACSSIQNISFVYWDMKILFFRFYLHNKCPSLNEMFFYFAFRSD
jgi:hypothetical protein